MKLSYSHCVKYTDGQPDQPPFSEYEIRTVDFKIKVWPVDANNDREEIQILVLEKPVTSCHVDLDEAISDAAYNLMNASREIAQTESRLSKRIHKPTT